MSVVESLRRTGVPHELLAQHARVIDVPPLVDDEHGVLVEGLFRLGAELLADPHGGSEGALSRRGRGGEGGGGELPVGIGAEATCAVSTLADGDATFWDKGVFVDLVSYLGGKREEGEGETGSRR